MRRTINEFEFIEFVMALLEASPEFDEVQHTPAREYRGTYLRPDIVCKHQGTDVVIEFKGWAPMVATRIEPAIFQLKLYHQAWPGAELVLAVPDTLEDAYKSEFVANGITVWDLPKIWSRFKTEIAAIDDLGEHEALASIVDASSREGRGTGLRMRLLEIKAGKSAWSQYQKLCAEIFEFLFVPPLSCPIYERPDYSGSNRRDIILPNYAMSGFWQFLRAAYSADYIVVDAKNYKKRVGKSAVLQMSNYLKAEGTGLFGIICCRTEFDKTAIHIQREHWLAHRKMILCLGENDVNQMLINRASQGEPADVIQQKLEDFRISL